MAGQDQQRIPCTSQTLTVVRQHKKHLLKNLSLLVLIFSLASCNQSIEKNDNETTKEGNLSSTISADTSKLSRLINLKVYKPTKVKFKYVFIDNSGQDKRLSVPGPSDYDLQAILYFDSNTYKNIKSKYSSTEDLSANLKKEDFNFEWLDKEIKDELTASDTTYQGHTDNLFGLGHSGKLWLLNNKLLIQKSTN